jgi:hypothetical protein
MSNFMGECFTLPCSTENFCDCPSDAAIAFSLEYCLPSIAQIKTVEAEYRLKKGLEKAQEFECP